MSSDTFHLPSFLTSQSGHSFPWDVVILAIIATALGLRLYRILGRRVGVQGVKQAVPQPIVAQAGTGRTVPPPLPESAGAGSSAGVARASYNIPAPATRVGGILADIAKARSGFNAPDFLKGVEATFRKIVAAYAKGERDVLSAAMTPQAAQVFVDAIDAREAAGETQRSEVRGLESVSILDAAIVTDGELPMARVEVEIVSRQISLLTSAKGHPLLGTEAVTEFNDLWLFETLLGSDDVRWRLAASRPA